MWARQLRMLCTMCLVNLVLSSVPVLTQGSGSSIVGVVKDESGGVLPGVTVEVSSPALIERVRTGVTDGSGSYQIIDLRPGDYSIVFTLEGFQTSRHEGVTIRAAFTATINDVLKARTLEESITVTGEAPVVDLRRATSEKALNNDLIEGVPTGRGLYALTSLMPATAVNKPDVGGSQTHQSSSISIHGSTTQDVTWNVDGMNMTTGNGTGGLTATYFNQGLQQDVSIQTKALSAEIGSGGVSVNVITKSGSNSFHGGAYTSFTNDKLQGNNVSADQLAHGLTAPGGTKTILDFNPEFGGPVVQDKLWFYSSYRYWRNDRFVASTFNPDGSQALDPQLFLFYSGTVTGKLNDKNRVSGYIDWNKKQRDNRRDLASTYSFVSPEASFYQRQGGPTSNAKWTSTLSNKLLLEAGFSMDRIIWHLWYQPSIGPSALSKNDISLSTLTGAAVNELTHDTPTRRNGAFAVSWLPKFAGSHNVRAGVQIAQLPYTTGYDSGSHGDLVARYVNGAPNSVAVYNTPVDASYTMWDYAAFVQDAWTLNRMTVGAGVRYERWTGRINPQSDPAGTFVPARSFDAIAGPGWNSVVPRLSVVYDVFGTGKTAIKASASKYMQQQAASLLSNLNPMRLLSEVRTWKDANVDGVPAGDGNWSQSGWARRGRQLYDGSQSGMAVPVGIDCQR